MSPGPLVRRLRVALRPDPSRVITTELLPAQVSSTAPSRMRALLDRALALPEDEATRALEQTLRAFGSRHRDLRAVLLERFQHVSHLVSSPGSVSDDRRRLIGALLSQEYAVEAAALFNPSMVEHPDQTGLPRGATRFLMSVRGVGEGHVSCAEFRTGTIDADDHVVVDVPGPVLTRASRVPVPYTRASLMRLNDKLPGHRAGATAVLASLPDEFSRSELEDAELRWLPHAAPEDLTDTGPRLALMAELSYGVEFPATSRIDSRVLMPGTSVERRGIEDVRLVRALLGPNAANGAGDGRPVYLGTYTAYDGEHVAPHILRTRDFTTVELRPLTGPAARNKGMALFPRPFDGVHLALSRWDRENSSLATSSDLLHWDDAGRLTPHRRSWDLVQTGNCGSPIETEAGWLVLTHGVGPMRQYSIGAMLLDLDDPRRIIGRLDEPLLAPSAEDRDGYVPNVVYSCGGMRHGDTLVLPYGVNDATVRIALVDMPQLLARLVA